MGLFTLIILQHTHARTHTQSLKPSLHPQQIRTPKDVLTLSEALISVLTVQHVQEDKRHKKRHEMTSLGEKNEIKCVAPGQVTGAEIKARAGSRTGQRLRITDAMLPLMIHCWSEIPQNVSLSASSITAQSLPGSDRRGKSPHRS